MSLEKWALVATIAIALVTTTSTTVTAIMKLQQNLRNHLSKTIEESDNRAIQREKDLKHWVKELFEGYYFPLDDRIKNLNARLKAIEKKYTKMRREPVSIETIIIMGLIGFIVLALFNKSQEVLVLLSELLKILISGYLGYLIRALGDARK